MTEATEFYRRDEGQYKVRVVEGARGFDAQYLTRLGRDWLAISCRNPTVESAQAAADEFWTRNNSPA